jgi:exosome complex component RRP40
MLSIVSIMYVVFPGQDLNSLIEEGLNMSHKTEPINIHIGSGIIQNGSELISVRPGRLLNPNQSTKFSLLSLQKRYVPLQNDLVIGIVTARLSELFRVDIGAQTLAVLPVLSGFDSSTKKNRPTWPVGTVIFARVAVAHPDFDPELACFDPSGKIAVDLFGELGVSCTKDVVSSSSESVNQTKSSILLRTTCNFSRFLQNPQASPLLVALGRHFSFEIASGSNGRIFIESGNAGETAALARIIKAHADERKSKSIEEVEAQVKELAVLMGKMKSDK